MLNILKPIIVPFFILLLVTACGPDGQPAQPGESERAFMPVEAVNDVNEAGPPEVEAPAQEEADKMDEMINETPIDNMADVETIVAGNTTFALDLYRQLRTEEGNLFLSPYSISTALAMTYAGARGNTEAEMAQALHFALDQDRLHPAFASLAKSLSLLQENGGDQGIQINIANALWPHQDYPFLESFLTLMKTHYGTAVIPVDYGETEAARQMINAWVEEQTNDKIKELLQEGVLTSLTRLVLVNAIYFKGDWAGQFDEALTETAPFWLAPGESIDIPLMTQKETFGYAEHEQLQLLALPYVGDDLAMLILLPKEIDGLAALENNLTPENLATWTGQMSETEVEVFLPKFTLSAQFSLRETLQALGIRDAFDETQADFSGMDGSRALYLSAVIHKAFVEVNEEGTEAAAATGGVISITSIAPPAPVFRADHPFIFLIRDNQTGAILFLGRVVEPGE